MSDLSDKDQAVLAEVLLRLLREELWQWTSRGRTNIYFIETSCSLSDTEVEVIDKALKEDIEADI